MNSYLFLGHLDVHNPDYHTSRAVARPVFAIFENGKTCFLADDGYVTTRIPTYILLHRETACPQEGCQGILPL